ncbi:hypothetical protein A9Q83_07990 [Alphaproteobacteria bacterium 46_93_T64]|nr:hypothetical protein A9Q83_07990 [Alphaproteobacteria bacterium 46_93_T64]
MRILVLGATGYIGSAIVDELKNNDHDVIALARSSEAEEKLLAKNIEIVRGDIRSPHNWSHVVQNVDAIIHTAATFTDDMGDVDLTLVQELISACEKFSNRLRFIYTGGVWLYGETGSNIATEDTAYNPINAFAWMIQNAKIVQAASCFDAITLHPSIVWDRDGGGLSRFITSIKEKGRAEVWGSLETHWPMVHREDLASAYRLAVESNLSNDTFNLTTEEGVLVRDIIQKLDRRFDVSKDALIIPADDVITGQGDWAQGPMLDQRMSAQKFHDAFDWTVQHRNVLSEI